MLKLIKILLSLIFLIQLCGLHALAADKNIAGSLNGDFSVNPLGVAKYSIPLKLSPSRGNLLPALEFVYDGQAKNGVLGVGWSLSGLPQIYRCPRNLADDGANVPVSGYYPKSESDDKDAYCLNGQRLILTSGSTSANDAHYHTEKYDFSLVTVNTETTNNFETIKSFILKTKDGKTLEFGARVFYNIKNLSSGAIETDKMGNKSEPVAYIWGLSKISDLNGNYWTVSYIDSKTNGILYPAKIEYTGNGDSLPNNTVNFTYEDRPDTDIYKSYTGRGSQVYLNQRLKKVTVQNASKSVRDYELNYQTIDSNSANKSRIQAITECNYKSTDRFCLPATTFQWTSNGEAKFPPLERASLSAGIAVNSQYDRAPKIARPDINHDGINDLVLMSMEGENLRVLYGKGSSHYTLDGNEVTYANQPEFTLTDPKFNQFVDWQPIFTDFNHDQDIDLIICGIKQDGTTSLLNLLQVLIQLLAIWF